MANNNENSRPARNPTKPEMVKGQASVMALTAENERLQERIKQLETERARDHQTIASLQAELDTYRRAVYAWALEQITDEQLQRYAQNEDGLPLDDFIGELDQGRK